MTNRIVIILAIFITFTTSCHFLTDPLEPTSIPTATTTLRNIHFENELVAFDYPEGTRIFSAGDPAFNTYPDEIRLGGELVVGLANPHWIKFYTLFSSIGVFRHSLAPGSSLDEVVKEAYQDDSLQNEDLQSDGPTVLDGSEGYQRTYRIASGPLWYTMRDIWIEKEGGIWRISIWEEAYAVEFQPMEDTFLNSLDIKDNLPPYVEKSTPEPAPSPTPYPASMIRHFENELVSFDYPKRMEVFSASDSGFACYPDFQLVGQLVAGLGESKFLKNGKYFRSIRIFHQTIPDGSNLESIMQDAYRQAETKWPQHTGVLEAPDHITIDGLIAVQRAYRVFSGEPAYELRDVWFQRDNDLFIVSIWTRYFNPEDLVEFQAGADMLLNSLKIK